MSGETVVTRRLGRGARLGIGLGVAGVFAIASFVLFVVALSGLDWSSFEELDGSATATVLNVEDQDEYGNLPVDVSFFSEGDRYVGVLTWPTDRAEPDVGDKVPVVFDTLSPESTVELDEGQGGGDDGFEAGYRAPDAGPQGAVRTAITREVATPSVSTSVSTSVAASVAARTSAVEPGSSGNRYAWAWWASLGCGLASVLTVVATAIWATRVPPKPPVNPPGLYGRPGPGGYPGQYPAGPYGPAPYPSGYPQPPYPQPPYQPPYPPQPHPQQYPPQPHPQQYPPQPYPEQYPPQPETPPGPAAGGYPPPS